MLTFVRSSVSSLLVVLQGMYSVHAVLANLLRMWFLPAMDWFMRMVRCWPAVNASPLRGSWWLAKLMWSIYVRNVGLIRHLRPATPIVRLRFRCAYPQSMSIPVIWTWPVLSNLIRLFLKGRFWTSVARKYFRYRYQDWHSAWYIPMPRAQW